MVNRRLILHQGIVADYDGAYEWVSENEYDDPNNSVGFHEGTFPNESYTVAELGSSYDIDFETIDGKWHLFINDRAIYPLSDNLVIKLIWDVHPHYPTLTTTDIIVAALEELLIQNQKHN